LIAMPRAQGLRAANDTAPPNDLESWWMPFTANRSFKQRPRMIARAKGMHYFTPDGRAVIDGSAGLWCCNAGHNRDPIVAAIQNQAAELDFAPSFQFGHSLGFTVASRIAELAPADLNHVFFCNSGSEAVDTALKIALAYWNIMGQGGRTRLIGRERGYHGVGLWRHLGRRHRRQPAHVRLAARRRRPSPPHLQPSGAGVSRAASRNGASTSPTIWSASSPCTTPRPSRPSSSSRWPGRRACCPRRKAT
jgi:adenosylmethionine-8-amino-7-oxononanoate aminotransferase